MNNGETFKTIVVELLKKDSKYDGELNNFIKYLEENKIIDKVFDLSIIDIDNYFKYSLNSKIGALPTLMTHIAALKSLFEYLIIQGFNFRDVVAYVGSNSFKNKMSKLVDTGFKKPVIPMIILIDTINKIEQYIEVKSNIVKEKKNYKRKLYDAMISRVFIKLSLLIPLKIKNMIKLKLGDIKDVKFRDVIFNEFKIRLPSGLRADIIQLIEYAESKYDIEYNENDAILEFLYKAVNQKVTTTTISSSLISTYKEIGAVSMLEQRVVGKKNIYIYPAESYKTTAILEMLNNGANIVYLKKLTGLDMNTLVSNYDFKDVNKCVDVESFNINSSNINAEYFTYI